MCAGVDSDFQPVCAYPSVSELILLNAWIQDLGFSVSVIVEIEFVHGLYFESIFRSLLRLCENS